MKSLFRTKKITQDLASPSHLAPCLNAVDLTLLGIGAIIGAGVFVLTGVAAATKAGPAITLSYVFAGLAALFSALSYAELASSVGGSGSAYNYAYTSFGELVAWLIGWALILEYAMAVSSVAVGWSGYLINVLEAIHVHFSERLFENPLAGGIMNIPAVIIIALIAFLLSRGVKQSALFNTIIVCIKLFTIGLFILIAATHVNTNNWRDFFPFGATGVIKGASIVFFAYIGFDALSTAAEETINPQRNLPIGIILSLIIATLIYVVVAGLLTGVSHYTSLNVASPVSEALLNIGFPKAAGLIAIGAIAGLTTVMLVMFFGLTRVLYAISRDGLLPKFLSEINPKTKTPTKTIMITGLIIAFIAGFVPLEQIAELVNIGTLTAFTFVCSGVIFTRWKYPDLPRSFQLPLYPLVPLLGIFFCLYLMIHLASNTWKYFLIWMGIGLIIYFGYSRKRSLLAGK